MARDTSDPTPLRSLEDLVDHMRSGEKPAERFRIGTEHEKFAFRTDDLSPVPYEGERGIRRLLERMADLTGWEPILDEGRIIGLAGGPGEGAISLEPGGQFELSGAALETLHETRAETELHLRQVEEAGAELGMGFLGLGGSPLWRIADTPRMPKSRYGIMERYMPKVGAFGLDMMFRTCTIQVNLDFSSERDMRRKMQLGMRLQPLASALFANSPFTDGAPNGLVSWRSDRWRDVDNQRSGLLPFAFEERFGYRDYAEWALDVPMYFVMRRGAYVDATDVTFRQFLDGALKGRVPDPEPNMGDWVNHLSTLFPDVRLKRFLEMRGADGGPRAMITALPAFWTGLLYDDGALDAAEALTGDWTFADVADLRDRVPREGLRARFRDTDLTEIGREVLGIAEAGLRRRSKLDGEGRDETLHLLPLFDLLAAGRTQADDLLHRYRTAWNERIQPVFDASRV